jgi:hypothetical protein
LLLLHQLHLSHLLLECLLLLQDLLLLLLLQGLLLLCQELCSQGTGVNARCRCCDSAQPGASNGLLVSGM